MYRMLRAHQVYMYPICTVFLQAHYTVLNIKLHSNMIMYTSAGTFILHYILYTSVINKIYETINTDEVIGNGQQA